MPNDKTQKNLSSLHNTLETMGYEVPNIDQFTKYMRKEKNLRTVYDAIASDGGYELPDFDTFKANMGWINPTPAGVPTPLRPKDQLAPTGKPNTPASPFGFDLPANPKKPSHAPKARLGFPRLDKKMRPVQEVNDPSVPLLKTTRDVAQDENGNVVNVVQPELVPDFDPNNGGVTAPKALMDVTTGKTIRPTELSKEEVDGYNAGNIDAVKDTKLRQALKEANIVYAPDVDMDKVHREQVRDLEQEIDADLKTAYDSFTDKAAAKAKDTRNLMRFGLATAGASMGGGAATMGMHANPLAVESDPEIYMLRLAKHNIQDAKNYIAEADHNAQEGTFSKWLESSFAGGAARGFAQKLFDARTWDMGIGDAGEAASIKAAVNKADLGEKLTPAEDKLLQSMVTKMAVEAYFNSQVGRGYTAGSVSAYSIPFMLEMATNPVSTSGNAIGAKLMRYAVRKFGLNVAGKALRNKAVKAAVKYGVGGLTSAAVSSAALTATSGTAHVAADAVSRNTGDLKFDYKADPETGELRAQYSGHEEGDDTLTATGKAFFMRFMENFSEYSGEALAPIAAGVAKGVGAGAKAAGKAIASRMGKAGAKILDAGRWGTKAARELIDNISASEFGRTITALEKKAHYNGKVLEFAEEKISDLASVLIGDKDLSTDKGKGFFNLDDNIDTFLGVSLTGGVISAAQTAGYFAGGGARGMARYQIGQSEGAVWSTLTTDEQRKAWDDVRRQILLQDGKEQVDAVKSALTNPNFNAEQRRAILDYTKSVQTYKGMSEYRRKQSEDTKADPLQNELADSYDKGAGMTEAEEMSHARSWYEFAQQKAAERLGVDAEALDEMGAPEELTLDQVAQLREEHNKQAVQSYVDYLNARATYEGMIGSVSQGIQAEAAQAEQAVRSQQHKDGALRRATLRGTEGQNVEVHIKDGDLVMDEEGRIDTDKSSKDFIVRDNETGVVRFASIDDIISAEQPTSADDAVSEAVNAVYERREKEAADAINGTITPQVGAVYNLLDADGNPQQIAIRQVGQDGTLDVDYSGVPHKMTTDELQTMADNTRARQIENEHAVQVQQAKAEEREEREQAGLPRYALNDELTIRTPEGDEVTAYVTNEEDADGNIEVYFNEPFDGKKVHLFTKDYLDGVVVGTRLSPETNTSAGAVEAPATAAAPALAQVQSVSEEVPEEATTAPTPTQEEENDIIGRSMTEEEAEAFLTAISNNHEVAPELELTPENWYAEFGEDGVVHTPIGDAHMGENQFLKMMRDGRKSKLGMIRPTLEAPHAIVEEPSTAKEGQETERDSSYIYIRVFEKEDGSRHYHFTSVSVQRDGGEVIVSNQEKSRNQVKRLLTEGVVLWMRADNAPDTSDVDQDLYSSQGTELSDPASEGTDASQSTPSESKDNESASHADPNDESLSPEEAYEAVLRAANGDAALALEVIKSTITDKEKALTKAKKAKPRSANTIDGKIQALAEVASGIEAAETSLAHWQAVAEIAAEQVQEEVAEVAEPVAEQTEQESEEPTTEQAPAEEETTEEQEEGVTTETEEAAPEAGDTQASDATGEGYRLSTIAAKRGGNFFENNEGSIDLVKISDNVFEAIGIKPLPMRMTEAMAQHIIKQHAKELGISTQEEAVAFVVDIMQHFDHVREGNKPNTYIFSIEKGRSRTGKRAVTLVLPSKSGEYLGVSSSGYEKVSRLKERALLWEEGANNEAPTTETASANVTSPSATQGGMTGGSASNQSNALSQGKDSEKEIAEGEANDGNQDDLSIEEKEALLSKAKQELEEKENERTAVAEQAIAIMKDYYDSGAIPGMDSGEFHGQATLILIGFKDRSNLELMKAPGLSELLPSLYKLADEARAKKVLVRKYEKELSQAKEVEGETLTHDKAIRDELVNTMRDAGIEVITDEAEGQAVLDAVHAGEAQMQRAYHGTDADFEAFDHSHMGEGAGGQAYGWGSYFTEEEGVARSYAGGGFVYEAELPDDTGSNYLHFESKPSNKDIARVKRELVEYILRNDEEGMYDYPQGKDDLTQEVDDAGEPTTWRDLYGTVSSHLGSDKEASAFFHSIGYVGIQYNSSETDGGKKNLVIFDESDISIQSKVRLFKTTSGEVYGFVKDGKIYLDLKHATAETAIHEYTHLWASALRRVNPRAWKSIRKQLKGFELWADVASRYPELKGDEDALADEVLAQYSGKRGTQRIEEEMKKADNATDLVGKARVLAAFNSLKEALKTFWTEVADFFGMDYYKSVEDAADKAMSDLLRGVNPNAVEAKEETTKKKPTKKSTAKKETATSSVIAPDSERYNGYIVTLPKSGKAGAEVGNIEEFVGADEAREGLMVVYQAPEGFAVASNGTMAIADKTQFDVYKKGKAYKLDGTTIDAGAWKPLKDKWQSFISMETRGENSDPFTESPVNITRLSKYLDRVEQDLYNRWKYAKSEGLTKDSFKTYRSRAMVSIPNGRGGYVRYRYPEMRSMTLAAKRLGVTSFFVEGDIHYESSVYPGVRLVGNGRLGSVVHAGTAFRHDAPKPSESELSYLYDEAVGVKDADQGVRMQKGDEGLSLQETSDAINARFNEELKEQIEGTLPKGHIYSLGMPSNALRSAGVPNLPIELTARRLATKASQEYHSEHPFELSDIQNLPKAIAHPIAVFDSSTRSDSTVVLTELQDSRGVNFVVALRVVKSSASRSLEIDVNGIRSIYPKDRVTSILQWITSGKMLWVDKKKALSWITTQLPNAGYDSNATESLQDSEGRLDKQRSNSADVIKPKLQASDGEANKQRSNSAEVISHPQEDGLSKTKIAQQRTNLADVDHLDLDSITKVVETFDNPPLVSEDLGIGNDSQASEDNDEEVRYRSDELDEVSNRFNAELAQLTEENSDSTIFSLGMPSSELIAGGVAPKLMRLYGNKVIKKMKKHGFALSDLLDLPKAVAQPIAVFSTHRDGSHAILTELKTEEGNILVTLEVGKGGADIDFNLLTSTYGKSHGKVVQWLNSGKATYINKEKALEYLASAPAPIAGAKQAQELSLATKVVETFENPELSEESNAIVQMEEVATRTAESLGEDVRVIHDTAEIEGRNESETSRMRGAKGWYDPKTGQVVVVLPNAESADDVEATILHEVVGHKGLQELVGKDQFGKFLDEVFEGANEAVRNGIVERSKRYGWNTRLATEEYIAELAEQGFKDLEARDLWNVVRNAFYNLLSRVKLALGWNISDRELRYMLWRTYQMKKGEGLMGQAKDIAMQEKLGVGNYEEARFRQGEIAPVKVAATYDALIKKSSYQTQEALQDSMLSLKKVMEMIMQAKGDAKYIEEIEGYQNAYMGENRVSSVNQAEAAAYSRMALEPLVEEVSRLAKKAHHSYVTDYMMAKHGLERNRVMAFQKAVEADVDAHNKAVKESGEGEELTASSLWDAYLNDTDRLRNEADYRNGNITADVWHKTDDEIRARYAPSYAEYRERDYAGLTGLLDRPDVDIQTLEEEAIEEVMKFEQENDVTDLWDLTNKATDAPLSKQYEGGLMSRETLEHVRNMYGYYIPLRGFDETTSDEAYSYLGDRDRAFSPTLKKAKGRSSKAEDPLAHIASMMESAILQSNRNKLVRQKFLNFVENNPSDLFSVQKLWVQWNNTTKTWDAVLPEFDPSDTSEEVIRKTQEFEEAMRKSQRENPELFKLASEQPSIPYRVVGQDKKMQHQIIVKRGGRDVVIIVNGDPRVAMAVNGLTNPDGNVGGDIGPIFKAGAALNRKLAGYYTSLSPNFVVKNFIRDIIYANTIVWVKESPSYALRYHKNVGKLALQMHRLVHLYEHDKLDMSNETHRAFKLFMENGGETGYSQLRSMDRHKKEIERMMKESGGRISLKQGFRLLGETMEFANRGIEDLSRFAAFLTSRQMGRTIDRSIYDAKEMTVNFNKKGAGSTFHDAHTQTGKGKAAAYLSGTGRSLYLFWNVSIQGSVNIVRAVKRNPKKGAAYLATFLALGILQTVLPALTGGDDDDRYWNLPDYVRRNNICFFVGDVLVKIPLPQEARAIFGIGELGMSYMSGKEDKDAWMVAYTIAGQLSQIMPLDLMDDSGPIHALMPSIFKPVLEAYTNHSWMGRPIWKDTDYNKAMPNWTKAYKSTGGVYVWLAKELNALSGGDDYKKGLININPARLEYLLKGYFGGLYTAADQIIKSSETAFGDREFSMRDVPILSGFLDGADERNDMRNVNNTYYHFKEEAKEVLRLGKSYESDLEQGKSDSTDYAKKLDELVNTKSYERALLFDDLSKEIEAMQKALKEATDPKEAEELQAEIDKQKKALVNQLRQMK